MKEELDATPNVTVVVPTYRDGHRLRTCIAALESQSYPRDRYSMIVVNNDPADAIDVGETSAVVINESAPGSYCARNAALRIADGDIIAFTDADCVPDPQWIKNGVDALLSLQADRVAGRVEFFSESGGSTFSEAYEVATSFNQERNASNGVSVTANLITWRHVLDEVGPFNTDLLSGGDVEWGRRASRLGKSIVYSSETVVGHPTRATLSALMKKARRVAGGQMSMPSGRMKRLIKLAFPPITPIRDILRSKRLSSREKAGAFITALILRAYTLVCATLVVFGISKPQRS